MASTLQLTVRRTASALSSTAFKSPTRQILRSKALPAVTTRGLTVCSRRSTLISQKQYQTPIRPQTQIRWSSDKPEKTVDPESLTFRQWGFEDINSTLPADEPSPTHSPVLIDVREPAELQGTGIIPHALSIPLASQPDAMYLTPDEFETRFGFPKPTLDAGSDSQLVFYCKAGVRADAAARLAVQAGYDPQRIGVYMGSWLDWVRNGGKVEFWDGDD